MSKKIFLIACLAMSLVLPIMFTPTVSRALTARTGDFWSITVGGITDMDVSGLNVSTPLPGCVQPGEVSVSWQGTKSWNHYQFEIKCSASISNLSGSAGATRSGLIYLNPNRVALPGVAGQYCKLWIYAFSAQSGALPYYDASANIRPFQICAPPASSDQTYAPGGENPTLYYCMGATSGTTKAFSSISECYAAMKTILLPNTTCYQAPIDCKELSSPVPAVAPAPAQTSYQTQNVAYYYCKRATSGNSCQPITQDFSNGIQGCNNFLAQYGSGFSTGVCYLPSQKSACVTACETGLLPASVVGEGAAIQNFYYTDLSSDSVKLHAVIDKGVVTDYIYPNNLAFVFSQRFAHLSRYAPVKTEFAQTGDYSSGEFSATIYGLKPNTNYAINAKKRINSSIFSDDASAASQLTIATPGPGYPGAGSPLNYFYCARNSNWIGGKCYQDSRSFNSAEECERYRSQTGAAAPCFPSYDYCNSFCNNVPYIGAFTPPLTQTQTAATPALSSQTQTNIPAQQQTGAQTSATPGASQISAPSDIACGSGETKDLGDSVPACKKCYCGMNIYRSLSPNPNAGNSYYWLKGFIFSQPNARSGMGSETEAKQFVDLFKQWPEKYNLAQCDDSQCAGTSAGKTPSSAPANQEGEPICYKQVWIYPVNNGQYATVKNVGKDFDNRIYTAGAASSAIDQVKAFIDVLSFYPDLYNVKQCELNGPGGQTGTNQTAQNNQWYFCTKKTETCELTNSAGGYSSEVACAAALMKYRTGDQLTTNKCYKSQGQCQNECKKYFYCPLGLNEQSCVRTSEIYASKEDCLANLRKYQKDAKGNYLTTNECYADRGSCDSVCKVQRYYYCNSITGKCDSTYQSYKTEAACADSLVKYAKDIAKPFKCFAPDKKSECDAMCKPVWHVCNRQEGKCEPFGQYANDIECEQDVVRKWDSGKVDPVCYSSSDACSESCGPKKKYYYCPNLDETCIATPEGFFTKEDCEKHLKTNPFMRVGLPLCFELSEGGKESCRLQCTKGWPTQYFCVKTETPQNSRCLTIDGKMDYTDCVSTLQTLFGSQVLDQCWPTLEACKDVCLKPTIAGVNITLRGYLFGRMSKLYYCEPGKGAQTTGRLYASVSDCASDLRLWKAGKTNGQCYATWNAAYAACK